VLELITQFLISLWQLILWLVWLEMVLLVTKVEVLPCFLMTLDLPHKIILNLGSIKLDCNHSFVMLG
jgi:hypothetical protein